MLKSIQGYRRALVCLINVLLLLLFVVGCSELPLSLPQPDEVEQTEAPLTPTVTDDEEDTIEVTEEPDVTVEPTVDPMPDGPYPPSVVDFTPRSGEEVTPDTAIVVHFDQSMDQDSVASAWQMMPDMEGELTWEDAQTLHFRPKNLASSTRYHVSLKDGAQSEAGLPLSTALDFAFTTLGPLTVTRISPAPGTADLRLDTPIFIAFNRPIVPLNCAGQEAGKSVECPELPVSLSPSTIGKGRWVNTSLYRYESTLAGWTAGEVYEVTLDPEFTSLDGATLSESLVLTFSTALPVIQSVMPSKGTTNVRLESDIRVKFNTPMDPENTGTAFVVVNEENGALVPGVVVWEDNGATLVFTPTQPLALGTQYTVLVREHARALTSAPLQNPQTWSFTTVPYPSVVTILPDAGASEVNPSEPVRIMLAGAIDPDTLDEHIVTTPTNEGTYTYWDKDSSVLTLSWDKSPRAEYCVAVQPGVADVYGNVIQEETVSCFQTGDLPSFLAPAVSLDTFTLDASVRPRLYFLNRNVGRVSFTLAQLEEVDFMRVWDATGTPVRRPWTENFSGASNEVEVTPVDLTARGGPLATGLYRLSWDQNANWWRTNVGIAVVDRHLTLKLTDEEALVWVTDLRSTEPITRTEVRLLDQDGVLIAAGTTNLEGLARIPISPRENLWDTVAAIVGEAGAPGFGIALSQWDVGAGAWEFDIPTDYGPHVPYRVYVHTDRPIYRPGQTVNFRGIVRLDDDGRYLMPAVKQVQVAVRDAMWELVYTDTLTLTEMGTFDAHYILPEDALVGEYSIEATVLSVSDSSAGDVMMQTPFTVAAYRKPEFDVSVTPEFEDLLNGEQLRVLVEGAYYFGGPVVDAEVRWSVSAEPYYFTPDASHDRRSWGSVAYWREPQVIAQGQGRTDAQGQFLLDMPAELKALQDADDEGHPGSQRWTVEVTLVDVSNFAVSGRDSVRVHAARFYLGVRPSQWIAAPRDEVEVAITALDWNSEPVPGQDVTVKLVERAWYRVFPKQPLGEATWAYTDTVVGAPVSVETSETGEAVASLVPPKSGAYVILAEAEDLEGNPVQAESSLWVGGPESARWRMPEGTITPVADLQQYQVGDIAQIMIPTPFTDTFRVLMTVERGSILEVQQLVFDEANPVVELPIDERYIPNVYVSFVAIRGVDETQTEGALTSPDVRIGMVSLAVDPEPQMLTVELLPERATYAPGETLNFTVRTVAASGDTIQAEVGLAVVDKAVLALREPNVPPISKRFYGERPLRVVTGNSLLTLFNRVSTDLQLLEKDAERLAAEMAMGGIGGGGGGMGEGMEVRQIFPDTAFWDAHFDTGPAGEAQVSFELPDSLTTWVIDGRAVTADTQVGQAQTEVIVTKPLLVRPVTPRFFVAGDRSEVAAVVHNNTGETLEVTVQLEAERALIDGDAEQTVSVEDGETARVTWDLAVLNASRGVKLTFSASGGGYQDATHPIVGTAREGVLPVYAYTAPDILGTGGVLSEAGERMETLFVPEGAGENSHLTLVVDPSLTAALVQGLKALDNYEAMSTDMLVGRFLPNVYTYQALQELGVEAPELDESLYNLVADALDRLYSRQNEDGGWGWWQSQPSNMYLTAYVGLGMVQAQRAGFTVREDNLQRALEYLSATLDQSLQGDARAASQPFTLFVLAEAEYTWPSQAVASLYNTRERLSVLGRAYLALALGLADASDPRVTTLIEGLNGAVEVSATGAHWVYADSRYWATNVLATSAVVDLLARFDPQNPLLPQAVRWLMTAREGRRWLTSYDTVWSLLALTDYMAATGDLGAAYTWSAAFNGVPLAEDATVTPEDVHDAFSWTFDRFGKDEGLQLRDGINVFELARGSGDGHLYYTAHLALSLSVDEIAAESRGIVVQREYCVVEAPQEDTGAPFGGDAALDNRVSSNGPTSCNPLTQVQPGDLVEVRLTMILPRVRYFVTLEDPYPAGMEPVNPRLQTDERPAPYSEVDPVIFKTGWWGDPFDRRELRDERAVFFARELAPGTYQVTYQLRAAVPGVYKVLPAVAKEMYFPEVWGRSGGGEFRIAP